MSYSVLLSIDAILLLIWRKLKKQKHCYETIVESMYPPPHMSYSVLLSIHAILLLIWRKLKHCYKTTVES